MLLLVRVFARVSRKKRPKKSETKLIMEWGERTCKTDNDNDVWLQQKLPDIATKP
jgi:hypothetical protein